MTPLRVIVVVVTPGHHCRGGGGLGVPGLCREGGERHQVRRVVAGERDRHLTHASRRKAPATRENDDKSGQRHVAPVVSCGP